MNYSIMHHGFWLNKVFAKHRLKGEQKRLKWVGSDIVRWFSEEPKINTKNKTIDLLKSYYF